MEVGDYVLIREKPSPIRMYYGRLIEPFTNEPLKVDTEENGYLYFSKARNGDPIQHWRYCTKKKQLHAISAHTNHIVIFHRLVLDITLLHPYTFT